MNIDSSSSTRRTRKRFVWYSSLGQRRGWLTRTPSSPMATFATDDWYALSRPIHCRLCSREHDPYLHVWSSVERVRVRWASELLSELSDKRLLLSDGKGTMSSMLSLTVRVKKINDDDCYSMSFNIFLSSLHKFFSVHLSFSWIYSQNFNTFFKECWIHNTQRNNK